MLNGNVIVRPTKPIQGINPEYVEGVDGGAYQVDAHFAKKEAAYIVAVNHWLRVLEIARRNLAALNLERLECLLGPSTDRSLNTVAKTTEPPVSATVSAVVSPTGDILLTSGN